jgi:hypothetical protein
MEAGAYDEELAGDGDGDGETEAAIAKQQAIKRAAILA